MKLKVKYQQRSLLLNCSSSVTFEEFISQITGLLDDFGVAQGSAFRLSLNRRDFLEADEGTCLSDLGIVSGDIIYILLPDRSAASQHGISMETDDCQSGSGSNLREMNMDNLEQGLPLPTTLCHSGAASGGGIQHVEAGPSELQSGQQKEKSEGAEADETSIKSVMSEPRLCKDATEDRLPSRLIQALKQCESQNITDAFVAALHVMMMEAGFKTSETSGQILPEGWKDGKSGVYRIRYIHPLAGVDTICSLVVCSMLADTLATVHGYIDNGSGTRKICEMITIKMNPSNFVSSSPMNVGPTVYCKSENSTKIKYIDLSRLSREFKDGIAHALTAALQEDIGIPHGILALPAEIQLGICSHLPAHSLLTLGQTCKQLQSITQDPSLWRLLYLKDFPPNKRVPHDVENLYLDWKEFYKEAYLIEKERKRVRMLPETDADVGIPFPLNPPPIPPLLNPPGIIGGDYDIGPLGFFAPDDWPIPGMIPRPRFDPILPGNLGPNIPQPRPPFGRGRGRGEGHGNFRFF